MSFGKYTYGKPNILWKSNNSKLVVENFCSIANNCNIYLGGNHRTDWVSTYPFGHIHKNIIRGEPNVGLVLDGLASPFIRSYKESL